MHVCVCERPGAVTLRRSFIRSRKEGGFECTGEGRNGTVGRVVSKEIDSSVASALIMSCILNVIPLGSLLFSLFAFILLSVTHTHSCIYMYTHTHIHTALSIINLAAREFINCRVRHTIFFYQDTYHIREQN